MPFRDHPDLTHLVRKKNKAHGTRQKTTTEQHTFGLVAWLSVALVFLLMGDPCQGQQAPIPSNLKEVQPPTGSSGWFYERALVNFVFERNPEAELDLTQALRKQSNFPEAYYLLGVIQERTRRQKEAVTSFEKVIATAPVEHVPARLRLITNLQVLERPMEAALHIEKLLKHLKISGPEIADERIRLQILLANPHTKPPQIFALIEQLRDRINIFLLDSARQYQMATVDRGLNDGLVGLEYVNLLRRQSTTKESDVIVALQKVASLRRGFAPTVYMQLGESQERLTHLEDAVSAFGRAVQQMKLLSFSESNGDYSAMHFRELQQKLVTQPKH